MANSKQPTKEQVRHYMAIRLMSRRPPPELSEIRRLVGWDAVDLRMKTGKR